MDKEVTQEEVNRVYQRSLAFRQAEKGLKDAADSDQQEQAKALHKEARSKWRDATDHILRKPP